MSTQPAAPPCRRVLQGGRRGAQPRRGAQEAGRLTRALRKAPLRAAACAARSQCRSRVPQSGASCRSSFLREATLHALAVRLRLTAADCPCVTAPPLAAVNSLSCCRLNGTAGWLSYAAAAVRGCTADPTATTPTAVPRSNALCSRLGIAFLCLRDAAASEPCWTLDALQ